MEHLRQRLIQPRPYLLAPYQPCSTILNDFRSAASSDIAPCARAIPLTKIHNCAATSRCSSSVSLNLQFFLALFATGSCLNASNWLYQEAPVMQ